MRPFLKLLVPLVCLTASQAISAESDRQPYAVPRTEARVVKSSAGQEYQVFISWPAAKPPVGGYPVAYVLDGNDMFPLLNSILQVQAGSEKSSKHNAITPGIVVGVGYVGPSRRNVDYTPKAPPAAPETYPNGKPYPPQPSGGADAFFEFLEKELKPAIEKDYPINREKQSLVGNGYSGLFALHILFNHPEAFQTYIASSPSVWWNGRYILEEEKAFAARIAKEPIKATLVMSAGDLEQSLTRHEYSWQDEPREEHSQKVARRRMVDNTREMFWRLEALKPHGLTTYYSVFPDESHKSVQPVAMSHALPYIFPPTPASAQEGDTPERKREGKGKAKASE